MNSIYAQWTFLAQTGIITLAFWNPQDETRFNTDEVLHVNFDPEHGTRTDE